MYILVAVDCVSKWVKALAISTIDHKVVRSFVKDYIYGTRRALIIDGSNRFVRLSFESLT